jgi:hypothetical protein
LTDLNVRSGEAVLQSRDENDDLPVGWYQISLHPYQAEKSAHRR